VFTRHPNNPLIVPAQVQPSRSDFEIIGTFNAGVIQDNDNIKMLVRVAERPLNNDAEVILCPHLDSEGNLIMERIYRDDPDYRTDDPRVVHHNLTGQVMLTSISHLRLAHSTDGVHFEVEPRPWLGAIPPYESFGIEDARITYIYDNGLFYINYTAVSSYGIATGLVTTPDFVHIERQGIIFPPSNRDVTLFPAKINGLYAAYHRPMPGDLGSYNMWFATSPDLRHWGGHCVVLEATADGWEAGRVGGGAPPVWTEAGWLSIYHAADRENRYCLGAFLTPHDAPWQIIARSRTPILEPNTTYEAEGFFGGVVFSCGTVLLGDILYLYYGAADERVALATAPLEEILAALQ
jgi:beta-1,2-mannobiose phosphorylase / 1,2-beta-oligomannan phosphorylase